MAQRPDLSRYLDAGTEFVALTRAQARARAKELVGQGQLAQEQVQGFVDDLVEESRRRTDEVLEVVRREIQRQVKSLGIATKDDLARLESRIATRSPAKTGAKKSGATKPGAKQKAGAKQAGAKKKAGAKKAGAKKKVAAKKAGAKKKVAAKKAGAKKSSVTKQAGAGSAGTGAKRRPRSGA